MILPWSPLLRWYTTYSFTFVLYMGYRLGVMPTSTDSRFDKGGIAVIFKSQSPFVYGSISYMKSDEAVDGIVTPRWSTPFLLSRAIEGEERVYGAVTSLLRSITRELQRIKSFQDKTNAKLDRSRTRRTVIGSTITVDDKTVSQKIVDEQDQVYEETLNAVAPYFRRLSDLFRSQAERRQITVFDYDGKPTPTKISLVEINNLLLHARYFAIRDTELYDLFTDKKGYVTRSDIGYKIRLVEYFTEVMDFVCNFTVRDLVTKLRGIMEGISISSDIADVIFLYQNLHRLGDSIISPTTSINESFISTILNSVANSEVKKKWPNGVTPEGVVQSVKFTSPKFYPHMYNLNEKAVRVTMIVNGKDEEYILDYQDFFEQITEKFGNNRLVPC